MKIQGKATGVVAVLAAITVPGIALADHNPNHGTGKQKPGGSPGQVESKSGIPVVNLCEPESMNAKSQGVVDGRSLFANCDDPNPDDDIDQSEINLEDYPKLQCPTP